MKYTDKEQAMIESRIIEPCLEFMEKIERAKDRNKDYSDFLSAKREELRRRIFEGQELILPRLVVIVGTRCSLRCRDCSNLMPHYSSPEDIAIEDLLGDLERLFSIVDECVCVNVIGGEAFLYPWLGELLDYLLHNEKIGSIELTTNATIIPGEHVLKRLGGGNPKVLVEVSDYGQIDILAKFIQAMDQYHVRVHVAVNMKWIDCGDCRPRNREKTLLREIYRSCNSGLRCKTFFKGKIFDCSRAAHLLDLGYTDTVECVDIHRCSKWDILSFFIKDCASACDYCDFVVREKKYVEPAIQMGGRHFTRSSCTVIPRDDYEEIWGANEWYRQQMGNYQKRVAELEKWTGELQKAKDWLDGQYRTQMERINELEASGHGRQKENGQF